VTVTLDHHALSQWTEWAQWHTGARPTEHNLDDQDRLAQWWARLSGPARAAFAADAEAPIPDEYLDEVMVGVRIVGHLTDGHTMQWRFAAQTREFIARQVGPGRGDTSHR
jgi:hypothetical protein